ncbi:MAG: dicarboxylate/amino acid:cation symporter [Christensenellaceae bacterium]|jgi:Na+/H+-dicarboxylate symporter|nr:dicarboxylate/amino acid:cation symporter [Christensenellaceae bacterium]
MESSKKVSFWKSYRFPIILIGSILIGCVLGLVLGEKASVLAPFGQVFINLMFTIVVPLVFTSVATAVSSMSNLKRLGKILGNMLLVFVVTGVIAAIIIIVVVKVWPPAQNVQIVTEATDEMANTSLADSIVNGLTVNDFPDLFSRSHMLPLIVFSILFGVGISLSGGAESTVGKLISGLNDVMMKLVSLVMYYAPIGLAAYFASLIGEFGPQLLGDYARAMVIYYPMCAIYFVIMFSVYSYYAGGKLGFKRMWRFIAAPAITAFATGSSVATIPVNLDASEKIGVSKDVREIVVPIGATMHMDGSVLSAILKISFLFGIFQMPFSGIGTYLTAVCVSVLSGVAMSGIPGGGLIGEALIVSMYGFPMEAFPLIATIGFLVDPPATLLNSSGDTVASMMVSRLIDGKDWLVKRLEERGEKPE